MKGERLRVKGEGSRIEGYSNGCTSRVLGETGNEGKYRPGKLPGASMVAGNIPEWIIKAGFQPLSVTPEHAQLAGSWNIAHRDPFDRMLAAQSKLEKNPLASTDKAMTCFPIEIIR